MHRQYARPERWSPTGRHRRSGLRPWLPLPIFTLVVAVSAVLVLHARVSPTSQSPWSGWSGSSVSSASSAPTSPVPDSGPSAGLLAEERDGSAPGGAGLGWHHIALKHRHPAKTSHRTLRTHHLLTLLAVLTLAWLTSFRTGPGRPSPDRRSTCWRGTAFRFLRAPPLYPA